MVFLAGFELSRLQVQIRYKSLHWSSYVQSALTLIITLVFSRSYFNRPGGREIFDSDENHVDFGVDIPFQPATSSFSSPQYHVTPASLDCRSDTSLF